MKRLIPFVALLAFLIVVASYQGQGILPYVEGTFTNNAGAPLALGKICTTISGSATNLATYPTYADAVALTNANTNPVTLDAFGRANIWIKGGVAYRIIIYAAGTGNTCNGSAVGTAIKTVDGISAGISVINALTINKVQMCDQYPGSTAGAQISACIAALPTTGGIADANGIQGAQVLSSDPFSGVTKPVMLLLSGATFTQSVPVTVPSNITLVMSQGAIISVNSGTTLSIYGGIQGSGTAHLTGSGTIRITQ